MAGSPTVARREFAFRVRARRDELKLSAETVSKALGMSRVFLSRIENGRDRLSLARFDGLVGALSLEAQADELRDLLELAHRSGWWDTYRTQMHDVFADYVGLEAGAEHIRAHEGRVFNGLLQTEDYATEIVRAAQGISAEDVRPNVGIRLRRQSQLHGDRAPRLQVVMGEAVLLQHFGPPTVLYDQIQHVIGLLDDERSAVDIRIQPLGRSPQGLVSGATVVLLDFETAHLPSAVYIEAVDPVEVSFDEGLARRIDLNFRQAVESSLGPAESLECLRRHAARIENELA